MQYRYFNNINSQTPADTSASKPKNVAISSYLAKDLWGFIQFELWGGEVISSIAGITIEKAFF